MNILFGIGNCGRNDDGLGWAFLDRLQQEIEFPGQVEYRYQLQIEDAELISHSETVVIVDAYKGDLPNGIQWKSCKPSADVGFTSHALSPSSVLFLCQDLYGKSPIANLLLIQGQSWDLRIGLSSGAQRNLDLALQFFRDMRGQSQVPE